MTTDDVRTTVTPAMARAEHAEAAVMWRLLTGAPASVRARFGISARRIGGGVALAVTDDPTGYWSKALGFGVSEPLTARVLAEVCRFYADSGVPAATVQVAPGALPPQWAELAAANGLEPASPWVKLQAPATEVRTSAPTDLRVGLVARDDADEWAHVLLRGFGFPPVQEPLFGRALDPAFTRVAAWDGPAMVAAASSFVEGDVVALFGASTLPSHRRRGAQSALLALRVREAVAAGARWVSAETGVESPDAPNPSLHNLRRAGLVDLYERQNWVWSRG
jgi:GNAT superfamily N-acetyltransferase